ncbi:diguanylate cyclase [Synechocystis sp. LKSZ1]|uniref:diguanylate cyclase domain-containing protein n=1 Tax=Synechocystis sp. LKSZ1 TaxID=3144951 RepID=UPI00336BF88B
MPWSIRLSTLPPLKFPLRWVLGTLFVAQVLGTAGLVGYLAYRDEQTAIQHLADEWITEVERDIAQELNHYLGNAQTVNQLNVKAVQSGVLNLENREQLGRYFLHQAQTFQFDYVNFGGVQGEFIGAGRGTQKPWEIAEILPSQPERLRFYAVNAQGQRQQLLGTEYPTQTLNRPWYLDAVKAGKPVWSEIYTWGDLPDHISISASAPVYDVQGQLQGVLGIDLELSQISRFLRQLAQPHRASIFIVERSGLLVASSSQESPAPIKGGRAQRLLAQQSRDPLIRQLSTVLSQQTEGFKQSKTSSQNTLQRLDLPGLPPYYVWVKPYQDRYGLDWLVVSSVPEEHLLQDIHNNWRKTLSLASGILLAVIPLGLATAHWIARPIRHLSQASHQLAQGQWPILLTPATGISELDRLTEHFQQMADQLQQLMAAQRQESERRFQKMAEATPSLLYIYDLIAKKNIYANQAVIETLGYSAEEIQALGAELFATICHPDDLPRIYEGVQQCLALADGEFIEIEYRIQNKQGQIHWLLSRDTVFARTEEGQPWLILGSSQDITQRKQAEAEARQIQQFLDSIVDNLPNMVFVKAADSLQFVYLNKAGEHLLGYRREDLLGKSDADFFPPEEAKFFIAKDREVLTRGEVLDIPEEMVQTKHQGLRILHTRKIPLLDSQGNSQYILGISEDITEQLDLENRLRQIARHIPGVIYQYRVRPDGTSHFPYASEGIRDIYGVSPEEAKEDASSVINVLHPDDLNRVLDSILESMEHLSPWQCEYRVRFKEQVIWVVGYATPRREPDGSIIWHGYIKDITERKLSELKLKNTQLKLQRANEELEKLVNLDSLTQIANRRCFDIWLEREWRRLFREQQPLSLLLFDVDFFKQYNDHYGHPQGDQCLYQLAQAVQQVIQRPSDLFARYGGEEFVIILPQTDLSGAIAVAKKVHQAVAELSLPHGNSEIQATISISIGITSLIPSSDSSPAKLIEQADQSLYCAKASGRNQSMMFTPAGCLPV